MKLKKLIIYKIIMLCITFIISTDVINNGIIASPLTKTTGNNSLKHTYNNVITPRIILMYENIWGTIYNPVASQCDGDPSKTGDGSRINIKKASRHRWIAISQDLLNDTYRKNIINDSTDKRFVGKLKYGDTIWISSPYKKINGWWVIHDTKNSRFSNSIDFLQTEGDYNLINDFYIKKNKRNLWPGKWNNIRIYKIKNFDYVSFQKISNRILL